MMKRFLFFLAAALIACSSALAENPAALPATQEFVVDFSQLVPDDPLATPVAVDPLDKPTPTPAPTPNYI